MVREGHGHRRRTWGEEGLGLEDLARFRQTAYRLFSTMLLYPDEERLKTVAAVAGELREHADSLATFPFFIQWTKLLDTLRGLADLEPARVQEEYVHLFMVNRDSASCLPYESSYVASGGAAIGWTAVELERKYAAAGLSISSSLNEPPDHAAVELEFMSFLCDQEARAWEGRSLNDGVEALRRQATFLEQHLSRWFPAFAQRVISKNSSDIYAAVTRGAETFINHDRDLLQALVERLGSRAKGEPFDSVSEAPAQGTGRCHNIVKAPAQKRA